MKYNIAIIGAGELGSRYLQGMSGCKFPLDIFVVDPSHASLSQAKERWHQVSAGSDTHSVVFLDNFSGIHDILIDVIIVATSSEGRADLIRELSSQIEVRYWVVEKVLAQSESELKLISKVLKNFPGAWVNTPRRMIKWYQDIIASSPGGSPITCTVSGGDWGLACNAIHFLDLVAWWSGEELVSIQTDELAPQWHKSKREGYWEIFGTLTANYSQGSRLVLKSTSGDASYLVEIQAEGFAWEIHELNGAAARSDGESISGRLEFQSEITGRLIESILKSGRCDLPTVDESAVLHIPLVNQLLIDWNKKMKFKYARLPIT